MFNNRKIKQYGRKKTKMTEQELKDANRTKAPVEWRGRHDYERAIGNVTALIYRYINGKEILSAEITSFGTTHCTIICRPDELHIWNPVN